MRVLIIEDEEKTADYLHRGLTEQGYTVDLARDGADDYLGKPFSFLELVARLLALTRRSGGHEPVQVSMFLDRQR